MTGLVGEWMHFGAASEGFRYVSMLERHLMLSQQPLSPVDRQALARFIYVNMCIFRYAYIYMLSRKPLSPVERQALAKVIHIYKYIHTHIYIYTYIYMLSQQPLAPVDRQALARFICVYIYI